MYLLSSPPFLLTLTQAVQITERIDRSSATKTTIPHWRLSNLWLHTSHAIAHVEVLTIHHCIHGVHSCVESIHLLIRCASCYVCTLVNIHTSIIKSCYHSYCSFHCDCSNSCSPFHLALVASWGFAVEAAQVVLGW